VTGNGLERGVPECLRRKNAVVAMGWLPDVEAKGASATFCLLGIRTALVFAFVVDFVLNDKAGEVWDARND
jgi:hypothetical protein